MTTLTATARRVRRRLGRASDALSRLGERLGLAPLIYHPGVMYSFDRLAQESAPGFASRLFEVFGPVRYLDVGAAAGRFTECLRGTGATVDGCEHSRWGRILAGRRGIDLAPFDLTRSPAGPMRDYDVAFCLEVAEHVTPELGRNLVGYLTNAPTVVFTAASPGQGGRGHINEQPKTSGEPSSPGSGTAATLSWKRNSAPRRVRRWPAGGCWPIS